MSGMFVTKICSLPTEKMGVLNMTTTQHQPLPISRPAKYTWDTSLISNKLLGQFGIFTYDNKILSYYMLAY